MITTTEAHKIESAHMKTTKECSRNAIDQKKNGSQANAVLINFSFFIEFETTQRTKEDKETALTTVKLK